MKIAQVCPSYYPTPILSGYGGIERVTWDRAIALSKLGHHVTNIAPRGSAKPPRGELIETVDARMKFEDEEAAYTVFKNRLDDFNVIIDDSHQKYSYLRKNDNPALKIMGVLHTHPTYKSPPNRGKEWKSNFVAVSKAHALMYSGVFGIPIVHAWNGIDTSHFALQKEKGDRYLWVGRAEPFKGMHMAIYLAKSLNLQLDLVGKTSDCNQDYVAQMMNEIKGHPNIRFWGEIPDDELLTLYQNAKAVILPYMWCLPPDQIVAANSYPKPIIALDGSEKVYGCDGELHGIIDKYSKQFDGELMKVKAAGCLPLKCSFEHRIFAKKVSEKQWLNNDEFSWLRQAKKTVGCWLAAKDVKRGDFVAVPRIKAVNKETHIGLPYVKRVMKSTGCTFNWSSIPSIFKFPLTEQVLRMMGLYVAEGSRLSNHFGGLCFSLGPSEEGLAKEINSTLTSLGVTSKIVLKPRGIEVRVTRSIFNGFSEWFGSGARNKRLPSWVFALEKNEIVWLLEGLLDGDGYNKGKGEDSRVLVSSSQTLVLQVQLLAAKIGWFSSICIKQPAGYSKNIRYEITLHKEIKGSNGKIGFFDENYYWTPISETSRERYVGTVHDIHVADVNSYLANNILVHNSEPLGLVQLESQSCGTPVIAIMGNGIGGGIPETIKHGETGFLATTLEEMAGYLGQVGQIEPQDCRDWIVSRFSREKMAERYVALCEKIVRGEEW